MSAEFTAAQEEAARCVARLMELCTSVQIVATFRDERDGKHVLVCPGAGSYYERRGAVDAWTRTETAFTAGFDAEQGRARFHENNPPPPDEGDEWKE